MDDEIYYIDNKFWLIISSRILDKEGYKYLMLNINIYLIER